MEGTKYGAEAVYAATLNATCVKTTPKDHPSAHPRQETTAILSAQSRLASLYDPRSATKSVEGASTRTDWRLRK